MELYLYRHAEAADKKSKKYPQDADRPLTSGGIKCAKKCAKGMRKLGIDPEFILTSPYIRAHETAKLASKSLGRKKLKLLNALQPGTPVPELIQEIKNKFDCNSLILVGHEPLLSTLASVLLTGSDRLGIYLKKCGLCKLKIQKIRAGSCAELEWVLTPEQLSSLKQS